MKNNDRYEIINFTSYDPRNSIIKADRTAREEYTLYSCSNKDNCDAYKRNKCYMLNGFGRPCPYGKKSTSAGYTKSSKKCGMMVESAKEKYKDFAYKLGDLKFVCRIGDYIYLNLPFLKNYVNSIRENDFFWKNSEDLIPIDKFTTQFIIELINYKPRALMGGVITDYQNKYIPIFVTQLKKYMPDMYSKILEINPDISELELGPDSYIGKLAYVKSLLAGKIQIGYSDTGYWDGNVIKLKGNAISFSGFTDEEIIVIPTDKTCVKICDVDTVSDDVVLKDE